MNLMQFLRFMIFTLPPALCSKPLLKELPPEGSSELPLALSFNLPNVTESCKDHWNDFLLRLHSLKGNQSLFLRNDAFWAIKMYDSYGKQPIEGRLQGSFWALGSASSCAEVYAEHPHPFLQHEPIEGKYCWAFQLTNSIRQGMCFPESCTNEDIKAALSNYADTVSTARLRYDYLLLGCDELIEPDFKAADIIMIVVFGIFGVGLLLGLLLDIYFRWAGKKAAAGWEQLLLGCSPYTNLIAFNAAPKNAQDHLTCINGIRFFSMSWVVLCHMIGDFLFAIPLNNKMYFLTEYSKPFAFRAILNGFPSVDSFYFMSGTLVGYLTFKELDKVRGRLNVFLFYIHRYIRLTGVYAVIILFHVSLLRFMPQGEHSLVPLYVYQCEKGWWKNLLYVNNFDIENSSCMGQTWYLATDMQMFWASPFMMVPLWWIHKKWGKVWAGVWAAGWLIAFTVLLLVLQIVNDWPASSLVPHETNYDIANYVMPWTRCQPYIVGIVLGFILHQLRGTKIHIAWWVNLSLWLVAFASGLSVIYALDAYGAIEGDPPSDVANAFFGVLHRLVWGLCLAWLVFACTKGYGGWINQFLSWEAFNPLSKLTYAMYLIHLTLIPMMMSPLSYRIEITNYYTAIFFLPVMVYTTAVSLVIYICLEVPLLNGDRVLFKWVRSLGRGKKE